jgi:hypothetical protein
MDVIELGNQEQGRGIRTSNASGCSPMLKAISFAMESMKRKPNSSSATLTNGLLVDGDDQQLSHSHAGHGVECDRQWDVLFLFSRLSCSNATAHKK